MELIQTQKQEQKFLLTQEMYQSLAVLQMPLPELRDYIQNNALSNPLIDLEYEDLSSLELPLDNCDVQDENDCRSDPLIATHIENHLDFCYGTNGAISVECLSNQKEDDFFEMLKEQLLRMKWLDDFTAKLTAYLIDCLDERGYLHFDVVELAHEQKVLPAQMEQALYVLQSLQPIGVGARSLEECLLLQLSQGCNFCPETILLVHEGLSLLGRHDYAGIAKLLQCSYAQAKQFARIICELNPIPSRGWATGSDIHYQIPEAEICVENGQIRLEMEQSILPRIHIDATAEQLLRASGTQNEIQYLRDCTKDAKQLIASVQNRQSTMERLLYAIVKVQADYFIKGEPLVPVTMSDIARMTGLSSSTISRTVRGKTVRFGTRLLFLKDFFSASLPRSGGTVSVDRIKHSIRALIDAEDAQKPLSDEVLTHVLAQADLPVSRRTVAKYRESMGIPCASRRHEMS